MPRTTVDGARIHWQLEGSRSGTPIVLLHSIGTDLSIYDAVSARLSADRQVLRIDLRGHGASDATAGEYSLDGLSRDVLAVLDDIGASTAVICGTSLGGMVAMQLVAIAPERVAGLLLANTSPGMSPALWPQRIATVREQGLAPVLDGWAARHLSDAWRAAHPDAVAALERGFAGTDPLGYLGSAAAIRDMDVLSGLAGAKVPVTVVAGEFDIATPHEGHGDRIMSAIPHAILDVIPAGHLCCVEQPEMFADSVVRLVERLKN